MNQGMAHHKSSVLWLCLLEHGLEAVLVLVELALKSDKPSAEHVLNVL